MKPVTRIYNLKDPKQARELLADARFEGKPITFVETADGKRVDIKDATDEQAVAFAEQIAEWTGARMKG